MENTKTPAQKGAETKAKNQAAKLAAEIVTAEEPPVGTPPVGTPPVESKSQGKREAIQKESGTEKTKEKIILKNSLGKEVPAADYFYKGIVPAGFAGTCGNPVDREDLNAIFHKVFKPEDNLLFYRQTDKEVYLVIIPIKYATEVGDSEDSFEGDFQKHAISFLTEGSVNPDTLRQKLEKINKFVKYSDR